VSAIQEAMRSTDHEQTVLEEVQDKMSSEASRRQATLEYWMRAEAPSEAKVEMTIRQKLLQEVHVYAKMQSRQSKKAELHSRLTHDIKLETLERTRDEFFEDVSKNELNNEEQEQAETLLYAPMGLSAEVFWLCQNMLRTSVRRLLYTSGVQILITLLSVNSSTTVGI